MHTKRKHLAKTTHTAQVCKQPKPWEVVKAFTPADQWAYMRWTVQLPSCASHLKNFNSLSPWKTENFLSVLPDCNLRQGTNFRTLARQQGEKRGEKIESPLKQHRIHLIYAHWSNLTWTSFAELSLNTENQSVY